MPSWFRRHKTPSQPASEPGCVEEVRGDASSLVITAPLDDALPKDDGRPNDDTLRPLQMQGYRYTQSFTASEENLYLAALQDSLQPVRIDPLPLWSESAPTLPPIKLSPSPIPNPNIPYPTNSMMQATSMPPGMPGFPTTLVPHHGLVTLLGDNGFRLTGFPAKVVTEVERALKTWPLGLSARSESPDVLFKRKKGDVVIWRAELLGKVWRLKGNQELESCRLLLGIFTALGQQGYFLTSSIQAASVNPEQLNLVFRFAPEPDPPCFMAVTVPLPDRVSLVSPPEAAANNIIEAVRSAINNTNDNATRTATSTPSVPAIAPPGQAIKLEGFIHPGVYRFWLSGLRRWKVGPGVVKRDTVAKFQPPLILAIMDTMAAQHFAFVGSVPLLPHVAGRDLLIFCSRPQSGLTAGDGYCLAKETPGNAEPIVPVSLLDRPPVTARESQPRHPNNVTKLVAPRYSSRQLQQRASSRSSQETYTTFQTQQTQLTHMEPLSRNCSLSSQPTVPSRISSISLRPPRPASYHSYNSFGSNNRYEPSLDVHYNHTPASEVTSPCAIPPPSAAPLASTTPVPRTLSPPAAPSPSLKVNGHTPHASQDTKSSIYSNPEDAHVTSQSPVSETIPTLPHPTKRLSKDSAKQPDTPAFEYEDLLTPAHPPRARLSPVSSIASGYYTPLVSPAEPPIAPPKSPLRTAEYPWGASPKRKEGTRISEEQVVEKEWHFRTMSPTAASEVSYASNSSRPAGVGSARTRVSLVPRTRG